MTLCQASSESSLPEFLADPRQSLPCEPPTSIDSPLPGRHGGKVPEASSQPIIWPLIAPFSWHEYMGHVRCEPTSELPEILMARVGLTDSGGVGPGWTSDASDVLAARESAAAEARGAGPERGQPVKPRASP